MKALVLGATGFIGGHIARAAAGAGWAVRALRRDATRAGILKGDSVDWAEGDLDDPEGLEPVFSGMDVVFHAAGYYPGDSRNVPAQVAHSVQQIHNVLDLVRSAGVKRLVYTSSYTTMVAPLDRHEGSADEDDHYPPGMFARSAYYESKSAMERALVTRENQEVEVVILNPTLVLGPDGNTQGTGSLFLAIARGWGVAWAQGNVNVVDVRDVARGHLNAAQADVSGERFLLGGHNLVLRELIETVARLAGVRGPRFKIPLSFIDLLVWMEDHLPGVNVHANHLRAIRYWPRYSNKKARELLDLEFCRLEDTITDALESYRTRGYL